MSNDLLRLADLAGAAVGPDREIDLAIFGALDMPLPEKYADMRVSLSFDEEQRAFIYKLGAMQIRYEPAHFTESLDAAMTLVPSPGKWSITAGHGGDWQACVWLTEGLGLDWHSAATPALALCVAALSVRAHLIAQEGSK